MKYTTLGKTGLRVSRMGLGGIPIQRIDAEGTKTLPLTGMPQYKFVMTISSLDCTGCGSCANVCPGKKGVKALAMESLAAHEAEQKYFDYAAALPEKTDVVATGSSVSFTVMACNMEKNLFKKIIFLSIRKPIHNIYFCKTF